MKKYLYTILFSVLSTFGYAQNPIERVDTLYYDLSFKRADHIAFAEYYRIALYPKDSFRKKLFRDFYVDGSLRAKGEFISINPDDDSKSVFDGTVESYYKDGKLESRKSYSNGTLNGDFESFDEKSGLVKTSGHYKNGLLSGIYTAFNEDGSYIQLEYKDGRIVHDYYIFGVPNGYEVKVRLSDNKFLWETPDITLRKTIQRDGKNWQVYSYNGITIAESCTTSSDYGKWHKIDLIISNDTPAPIEFNPVECVSAYSVNVNEQVSLLNVWSSEEYIGKVTRVQNLRAAAAALGEYMASSNAGYSTSSSSTMSSISGTTSMYGTSISPKSYASFFGSGYSSGLGYTTTTTTTYDAAAAYRARVIAQQRVSDFTNSQWIERKTKEVGYLKGNTILPGETVSGYVNIERTSGSVFFNIIHIGDAEYQFCWRFGDDPNHRITERTNYLNNYANHLIDNLEMMFEENSKKVREENLSEFFEWFIKSKISEERTVKRVIGLQNHYVQYKCNQIDQMLEAKKRTKAEFLLGECLSMYEKFPLQTASFANTISKYSLTPKYRKEFKDGVYSN